MTTGMIRPGLAAYDAVADEYYDPDAHPTCADFRELSDISILNLFGQRFVDGMKILEVGAGQSSISHFMHSRNALKQLTILDISAKMLNYSKNWSDKGASLVVEDARKTGFSDASFDAVIGSLCDPFNVEEFWLEARRLLRVGGWCIITTPAIAWAKVFRKQQSLHLAEFLVGGHAKIDLESYLYDAVVQEEIIVSAGLRMRVHENLFASQLRSVRSKKTTISGAYLGPVVCCWLVEAVDALGG